MDKRTKHGMSYMPEYRALVNAIARCNNRRHKAWNNYGGRGITVCRKWMNDFRSFLDDVGNKPGPGWDLDRINNDGNYEPGNVRWSTRSQNCRNTRRRKYEYNGKIYSASDLADIAGISCALMVYRLKNWPDVRSAVETPREGKYARSKSRS